MTWRSLLSPPAWRTWPSSPTRRASAAATAGKLGAVPPAVATFATTVKGQHQQHADAWNAVLKSHGKAPVTVTNPKLTPTVQADFAKVTNITGLAELAVTLETIAAQTYQAETSMLKSEAAIGLSSSIQPVEMQHIAILYYVLGMYPGAQTSVGYPAGVQPDLPGGLGRHDNADEEHGARLGAGGRRAPRRLWRRKRAPLGLKRHISLERSHHDLELHVLAHVR